MLDLRKIIETSILSEIDDGGIKVLWIPTTSNSVSNASLSQIKEMSLELGMEGASIVPPLFLEREVIKFTRYAVESDLLYFRSYHSNDIIYLDSLNSELSSLLRSRDAKVSRSRSGYEEEIARVRQRIDEEAANIHNLVDAITEKVCSTKSIIVEHSPPSAESLLAILKTGSGVAIGSWLGLQAASGFNPMILFAAVPMGIIVCGAAAGISEGLQRGLKERITLIISPGRSPRRRT